MINKIVFLMFIAPISLSMMLGYVHADYNLAPAYDTWTDENDPASVKHDSTFLYIQPKNGSHTNRRYTWINYDLDKFINYTNITSSTLSLSFEGSFSGPLESFDRTYRICMTGQNWTESGLMWNTHGYTDCTGSCSVTFTADGSSNVDVNISSLMQKVFTNSSGATGDCTAITKFTGFMIKDNSASANDLIYTRYRDWDFTSTDLVELTLSTASAPTASTITPDDSNTTSVTDNTIYDFTANYQGGSYTWTNKTIWYSEDGSTIDDTLASSTTSSINGDYSVSINTNELASDFYILFRGNNTNGDLVASTVHYINSDRSDNTTLKFRCIDSIYTAQIACNILVYNNTCDTYSIEKIYYPDTDFQSFTSLDNSCTYSVNVSANGYDVVTELSGYNPNVSTTYSIPLAPASGDQFSLTLDIRSTEGSLISGASIYIESASTGQAVFPVSTLNITLVSNLTIITNKVKQTTYTNKNGLATLYLPAVNTSYIIVIRKDGYSDTSTSFIMGGSRSLIYYMTPNTPENAIIDSNLGITTNGSSVTVTPMTETSVKSWIKFIVFPSVIILLCLFFYRAGYDTLYPPNRRGGSSG